MRGANSPRRCSWTLLSSGRATTCSACRTWSLLRAIETRAQIQPPDAVEAVAHGAIQPGQAVFGKRMGLEQQGDTTLVLGDMADLLQYGGQAISVVTGARGQHHTDAIRLELGILVEAARHDLGAAADQLLHLVVAADLFG